MLSGSGGRDHDSQNLYYLSSQTPKLFKEYTTKQIMSRPIISGSLRFEKLRNLEMSTHTFVKSWKSTNVCWFVGEFRHFETLKLWNFGTLDICNFDLFHVQVRESLPLLNIPTPTPAPDHPLGGHEGTWGPTISTTAHGSGSHSGYTHRTTLTQ